MKNFFKSALKWFVGLPKKTQIISAVVSGVVLVGSVTGIAIATAHRHEYLPTVTAATCLEQGYTTYQCECGETYVDDYVAAKGHTDGEWIVDAGATCTEDGSKHQVCSVCDATIKTETLSKIDHSWKNATCTTPKTCSTCNATSGTALGHSWKNATCTTPKTCSTCNTMSGSALGHSWKNATCTTPKTCSTCNTTSGSALGHSWKNATCTTPKTCSTCNATSGSALGHSWKNATCTTPKTCSTCNFSEGKALGHTTNDGICSRCGADNTNYYNELRNFVRLYANGANGSVTNGEKYWCYEYAVYVNSVKYMLYVKYFESVENPTENRIETFVRQNSHNVFGWTFVEIVYTESSGNIYAYNYIDTYGNANDKMVGWLDATSITSNTNILAYTEYYCKDGYHSATKVSQNAAKQLKIHLQAFNSFLNKFLDISIDKFGYENY